MAMDTYATSTQLNVNALGKDQNDLYYDPKRVLDEVHGYIEISPKIKEIIDTPHVQRLRGLKQLGATYYVFPGGSHNRFEHSLGVMHLAGKVIRHIRQRQPNLCNLLEIDDETEFCIRAAGLLHDLGHGPFSHVFDHEFIPSVTKNMDNNNNNDDLKESKEDNDGEEEDDDDEAEDDIDISLNEKQSKKEKEKEKQKNKNKKEKQQKEHKGKFRHEDMSVKLIDDLFSSNNISILPESLSLIKALVSPSTHNEIFEKYASEGKGFLFQIIANEQSGIDVDKWDYMLRDSRNCDLGVTFNYSRLLEHCRVIEGNICYHDKTAYELYLLFRTRYELFRRVYSHKTSKAIEYMICDILKYANPIFKIVESTYDISKYLKLKDCIIDQIDCFDETLDYVKTLFSKEDILSIKKAKYLIHRWYKRELYRNVGYCLLEPSRVDSVWRQLKLMQNNNNIITTAIKEGSKEISEDVNGINNSSSNSNSYQTPQASPEEEAEEKEQQQQGHKRKRRRRLDGGYGSNDNGNSNISNQKLPYHEIESVFRSAIYEIFVSILEERNAKVEGNNVLIPSKEDDILIVQLMSLSYGMEDKHPIEQVYLFNSEHPDQSRRVQAHQISYMDSSQFREIIFRCYVKEECYKNYANRAFQRFLVLHNLADEKSNSKNYTSLRLSPHTAKTTLKRININNNNNNSGVSDDNIVNNIFANENNPNGVNGANGGENGRPNGRNNNNKNGKKSNKSILGKRGRKEMNEKNERNDRNERNEIDASLRANNHPLETPPRHKAN